MSRKFAALIVGAAGSLALLAGGMQGCGSSSNGSGSDIALCEQVCDKALACTPDAGTAEMQAAGLCKQNCPSTVAASQSCSNHAARVSAFRTCVTMDCAGAVACLSTVPDCQGGTGGAGGSTGTGGAGGAAAGDCSVCTKADQCCAALDPNANCVSASACATLSGPDQTNVISICQGVLNVAAGQPTAPAACK